MTPTSEPADLVWEAPGPGVWFHAPEHFPVPATRLFAYLFPQVTVGWENGAERYGFPTGEGRFATVNSWFYYGPPVPDPAKFERREAAAKETLATARWRDEVRQWFDVDAPRLTEINLALQQRALGELDDEALARELERTVDHFCAAAILHFEPSGFSVAGGRFIRAAQGWGIGAEEVAPLLAGASPGSRRPLEHLDAIVDALREAGKAEPGSLDEARAASPAAAAAIDAYLEEFGWRSLEGHELNGRTLGERPDVVLTSILCHAAAERTRPELADPAPFRERVPEAERDDFDALLADVRLTYQINDHNVGICFGWPLGLVRRALLEVGARLEQRGRIQTLDHVFESEPAEAVAMLDGGGPAARELRERAEARQRAARATPPPMLGEPPPQPDVKLPPNMAELAALRNALWGSRGAKRGHLTGLGIGDGVHRGRAYVTIEIDDAYDLEPGGVLIARTTTAAHNALFPIAGAVATEEGGLFGHTAVLSRELGLPAVVGAQGLLESIATGDLVEVDAHAGVVRIIERR